MSAVSERAVAVAEEYLGFTAETFLKRQWEVHEDTPFDELDAEDLPKLAQYAHNAGPLVMEQDTVAALREELLALRQEFQD